MPGPLNGLKVIEMVGLGPAPFAAMMLADHGADVLRIDRPGATAALGLPWPADLSARGRPAAALDLRSAQGLATAQRLIDAADVLIEGFRPGVMERLGLGPDACLARNPRLVYGRMTGWGQQGPLASTAGHDLNYLALTGGLAPIGPADAPPPPPLNYVADYGGGAMFLLFGVLAALHEAQRSGRGQVVDAAMVDGAAVLATLFHGLRAAGRWEPARESNLLDGGFPFYRCYRCADGRFVSVGPLERPFRRTLLERLGLVDDPMFAESAVADPSRWPQQRDRLAAVFAGRSRDDWAAHFDGTDACVAPVLDWDEAPAHPHLAARGTFVTIDGVVQARPAPRYGRSEAAGPTPPVAPVEDAAAVAATVAAWLAPRDPAPLAPG